MDYFSPVYLLAAGEAYPIPVFIIPTIVGFFLLVLPGAILGLIVYKILFRLSVKRHKIFDIIGCKKVAFLMELIGSVGLCAISYLFLITQFFTIFWCVYGFVWLLDIFLIGYYLYYKKTAKLTRV